MSLPPKQNPGRPRKTPPNNTPLALDIDAVLRALEQPLTRYGAAQLIAAETDEELVAIQMRLSRWAKGQPPKLDVAIRDLGAIGFRVVLVAK